MNRYGIKPKSSHMQAKVVSSGQPGPGLPFVGHAQSADVEGTVCPAVSELPAAQHPLHFPLHQLRQVLSIWVLFNHSHVWWRAAWVGAALHAAGTDVVLAWWQPPESSWGSLDSYFPTYQVPTKAGCSWMSGRSTQPKRKGARKLLRTLSHQHWDPGGWVGAHSALWCVCPWGCPGLLEGLGWVWLPVYAAGTAGPNSFCALPPQAGGLMHVALPTWTGCIIHRSRTQISSMVLSGTTGRGQATHSRPPPWWFDVRISKCLCTPQEDHTGLFQQLIPKHWKALLHCVPHLRQLRVLTDPCSRRQPQHPLKPTPANKPKQNPN